MKFEEAMRHMLGGHDMRRDSWDIKWTVKLQRDEYEDLHFFDEEGNIMKLTAEDITATDWFQKSNK